MTKKSNLLAVVSAAAPQKERARLERDYETVSLPPDPSLPPADAHRPDTLFFPVGGALIFRRAYRDAFPDAVESLADRTGMRLILTESPYTPKTGDAALWRDLLIGRRGALLPEFTAEAKAAGYTTVPVLEKYSGRACLVCGDALLTSGWGIHKTLRKRSENVWFCPAEGIVCSSGHGFLGGAAGEADGVVYFFGDPSSMEYAETLSRFLDHFMLDYVLLDEGHPLTDRGGIRFLKLKE